MPRVLVIQSKPQEDSGLVPRLHGDGFETWVYPHVGSKGFRTIRESPPDAILIDLRTLPSYGRAMGALLRETKSLRAIPVVFLEGDPAKSALLRQVLPKAVIAPWPRLAATLQRAIAQPHSEPPPHVPPDTPVHRKLRIRSGSVVALLHASAGIQDVIGAPGAQFRDKIADASIVLLFVKSAAALGKELPRLAASAKPGRALWIAWPKKASAARCDLSMPGILDMCRSYGLGIGKICALDDTWSALQVSKRKRRATGSPEARRES